MIDSDDVLLLRPAHPDSGFQLDPGRPVSGSDETPDGIIVVTTWHLQPAAEAGFQKVLDTVLMSMLHDAGVPLLAIFASEHAKNGFPALPVREDAHAFVWFSRFADRAVFERHAAALASMPGFAEALRPHLARPPEVALLSPTTRSRLRG
jgi:hypothetical protein